MAYSPDKLNENIRVLSDTLQVALNAINYLLTEDSSNTQALAEKTAEIESLKGELNSVDAIIGDSFSPVLDLAKEVMARASAATAPVTEPEVPVVDVPPVDASPVDVPSNQESLPIGGEPAVTPLKF